MTNTPTPSNVPTQIYVRFPDAPDENGRIEANIGCDGEDRASPEVRAMMSAIAMGIAITVQMLPDGTEDGSINGAAAENAIRIAKAIFDPEKEGGAEP